MVKITVDNTKLSKLFHKHANHVNSELTTVCSLEAVQPTLQHECYCSDLLCVHVFQTRVLVTHGLSSLSKADFILVMENGQISEMGSYMELMERKGAFAKLIQTHSGNQRRESTTLRDKSKT